MANETSFAISETLARTVEGLCQARPGVPLRELVEVALATPDCAEVSARVVPTATTRVAIVWVDQRTPPADELLELLTPREREVALLVADGARNREIASRLGIAESTVKDHVHRALDKLGCESRAEIVSMLLRRTSRAEPNRAIAVADDGGETPLMSTESSPPFLASKRATSPIQRTSSSG